MAAERFGAAVFVGPVLLAGDFGFDDAFSGAGADGADSFFAAFFGDEERPAAFFAAVTSVAGVGVGVGAVVGVGSGAAGGTGTRFLIAISTICPFFDSTSVLNQL